MFYKLLCFVYCFSFLQTHRKASILFQNQPHSRGEHVINGTLHSPFHTHSTLDSANVSGHNMHSFQTVAHSLCIKSMSKSAASVQMMFFYISRQSASLYWGNYQIQCNTHPGSTVGAQFGKNSVTVRLGFVIQNVAISSDPFEKEKIGKNISTTS